VPAHAFAKRRPLSLTVVDEKIKLSHVSGFRLAKIMPLSQFPLTKATWAIKHWLNLAEAESVMRKHNAF
jgi:hypothetical protein